MRLSGSSGIPLPVPVPTSVSLCTTDYTRLGRRKQNTIRTVKPWITKKKEFALRRVDGRDRGVLYFCYIHYRHTQIFSESFCTAYRVLCFFCLYLKLLATTEI